MSENNNNFDEQESKTKLINLLCEQEETKQDINKVNKKVSIIIVLLIFLFVLLIASVISCILKPKDGNKTIVLIKESIESTEDSTISDMVADAEDIPMASDQDYIELPFVSDISVNSNSPVVQLYNPESNKDLFEIKYTFTDSEGNVLLDTDWIRAEQPLDVNIPEYFEEGSTTCNCSISGRYIETQKAANGAIYTVKVNYKEVD